MIKRNNKGFTLLELLISIFILTTVIFLGYRVINKSTVDVKNQSNINKGQLTINDMNVYLTKDLEQASSITLFLGDKKIIDTSEQENLLNDEQLNQELKQYLLETENGSLANDKFTYSYNIRLKEDEEKKDEENENDIFSRIYSVEIIKDDKDNYIYSVSREETDGISISFITNEILKEKELPFMVEGNNPYKVSLGYNGKGNKFVKHEFTVTSRLYVADGDNGNNTIPPDIPEEIIPPSIEEVPEIPPDVDKNYFQSIGYWMMDTKYYDSTKNKGDLYTWIQDKNGILDTYGKQGINTEKFYILATNSENSSTANSGNTNAHMKDSKEIANYLTNISKQSLPADQVNKIKIYVSAHTTLEQTKVKITSDNKEFRGIKDEEGNYLSQYNDSYTLEGGDKGRWYDVEIKKIKDNGNKKINFIIDGMLSIDKKERESGYAMIVYGDAVENGGGTSGGNTPGSDDLDGDIVFEFTRTAEKNVNMTMEINVGNNPIKSPTGQTANSSHNVVALVKTDSQSRVDITGVGDLGSYDDKFKTVKGVEVKLVGNITVPRFKIDNIMTNEISLSLNYNNKFYFTQSGQYGVRFNEVRFDNLKNGETGVIIINLIY